MHTHTHTRGCHVVTGAVLLWQCVWVCVSLHVCPVTHRLTEVTVDQMDPDTDDLIKWSIIRPPTPADTDCEG